MRRLFIVLAHLVWVASSAQGVAGQLTVRALGAPSDRPLRGALVTLGDADGHFVGSMLTDGRGVARFDRLPQGTLSVRVEMIGHATASRSATMTPGQGREVVVRLPVRAVRLEGLEVAGEPRCAVTASEGRLASEVWDEVRRALEAARWTADRGLYRYRVRRSVRDVELRSGRLLAEEGGSGSGWGTRPYHSLTTERLHAEGFVQSEGGGGDVYYAPDEEVLLSDLFLENHCLRAVLGDGATAGWVGLAFRPIGTRSVPDISGTLWIEQDSWELRRLDFAYEGLRRATPVRNVGGSVHFRRLPDGTWIVPEWTIRTPLMGSGTDLQGRRQVFQMGVREEGGEVLEVRQPGGRIVMASGTGFIDGTVVDSAGTLGIPGATVILEGEGVDTRTDSLGTFVFSRLEPGTYRVSFTHESLPGGYEAPARMVELRGGQVLALTLALPTTADIVAHRCRRAGAGSDEAVAVTGRVMDASTGLPLAGARLSFRRGREAVDVGEVVSGSAGWYLACGVRGADALTVSAEWGPFASGEEAVAWGVDDHQGRRVGTADVAIPLLGSGAVRGRVVEEPGGVPVEGVQVEVVTGQEGSVRRVAETDPDGRFVVEDVPAGRHYLAVSHARYRAGGDSLAIGGGEDVEVEVAMAVIDAALDRLLPGLAADLPGPSVEVIRRERPPGG